MDIKISRFDAAEFLTDNEDRAEFLIAAREDSDAIHITEAIDVVARSVVMHATFCVAWSEADREYVATCDEFPGLSWLAADPAGALRGIKAVVHDTVADMVRNGEPLPAALD